MKSLSNTQRFFHGRIFVAVTVLLLGVSGCVDTSAVTQFAQTVKVANEKFPPLAKDYNDTCVRTQIYGMALKTPPVTDPDIAASQAQSACTAEGANDVVQDLLVANKALTGYMDALSRTASNNAVDIQGPLGELGNSLKETHYFKAPQITATKNLLGFFGDALTAGARHKHLSQAIGAQNDNIQKVCQAMINTIEKDYVGELNGEQGQMRNYYTSFPTAPTASVAYRERVALNERKQAAAAYVQILSKIAEGHQQLYDNRDRLTSKQVRSLLLDYSNQLDPLIKELNTAF